MTKPENFTLTSDYATLKNDATTSLTITLPGSLSIAAGGNYLLTATASIGTAGASERSQIHSSKWTYYWLGNILSIARDGLVGGSPANYLTVAELYRSSATQVTAQVSIRNPYAGTLSTVAGDETFTFYVSTFLPPFA